MISIKYVFLALFCVVFFQVSGSDIEKWNYETGGKVTAKAVVENGVLYVGSSDKHFYALNALSGELNWKYEMPGEVKTNALLIGNAVVVHTQSLLLALNKSDGSLQWQYTPEQASTGLPRSAKDEWDYHASSPIVWRDSVCYGDDFGQIHVVSPSTGEGRVLMALESEASIKTELCISDGVIYFGDWDSYVHAYDVAGDSLKWSFKSFDTKPYASYGPIITKPVVYKNKLYVGARNYDFTVLNIDDGSIAWQYNEPEGGWLTGTPLIVNDTLYMGCSDNKAMIAFDANTGEKIWTFRSKQNIFCEPHYRDGMLLFTDGDSYNHGTGEGYLYLINASDGDQINTFKMRNSYSSPICDGSMVYFGSYDNKIHAISWSELQQQQTTGSIDNKHQPAIKIYPNPVESDLNVQLHLNAASKVDVKVYSLKGEMLISKSFTDLAQGMHTLSLNVDTQSVVDSMVILALNINGEIQGVESILIKK